MFIIKKTFLKVILILFISIFITNTLKAQTELALNVDTACYPESDNPHQTLLEVYYTFPRHQLRFIPKGDSLYEAAMDITMRLDSIAGDSIDEVSWRGITSIRDLKELNNEEYKFFDTVPAYVDPGDYYLTVGINDVNSGVNGRIKKRISIPDFSGDGIKLSQIELAYTLNPDTSNVPSAKDGTLVIPNASRVVIPEENFLFFYAELHNMAYSPDTIGKFRVDVKVLDDAGNLYRNFYSKTFTKPGSTAVISNGINPYPLPDGFYKLQITATDLETRDEVSRTKRFRVKHSGYYAVNPLVRKLYSKHPEAERIKDEKDAKLVRKEILYIASPEELKIYGELNIEGKNNFMKKFWRDRDPDTTNGYNEFEVQHYARLDFANKAFASRSYSEGWATDMGRVFILYGPPSQRETHPLEIDTRPYEVWYYYNIPDQPGERIFVFVDFQGQGDYRLFHSNVKGEKYEKDWQEKLQISKVIR